MVEQVERFWSLVDKTPGFGPNGDCWNWKGPVSPEGYARLSIYKGSHISLEIHDKPRPKGYCALHSCDNPPCCNPDHLRWGTNKENVADMIARKRHHANRKTVCVNGHPLSGYNLYVRTNGQRACRQCSNERTTAYRIRLRAQKANMEAQHG
jgi:hypothetical protein